MRLASTPMTRRSDQLGFSLMNGDSANRIEFASDCHHNNTPIPLPLASVSPFPHTNEISQSYRKELEPAGVNSMIDFSQFQRTQAFQKDRHNLCEGEGKSLLHGPVSGFPFSEGYIRNPYQYTRHENLPIPDDVMSAAFNLNNVENPNGGGNYMTPSDSSALARGPQMVNPIGMTTHGDFGQPLLNMNLGMASFSPNQGCAVPMFTPGKLDERFMNFGSGSNEESKSNTDMSRFNINSNSERIFLPPLNTHHNQVGSRSFLNPGLDVNDGFSGFQNNSKEITISDLAHTGDHEVLFGSRPRLHLGPQYAFQRRAASDQNHHLRPVNRDLSHGNINDRGMKFADVHYRNGFERCMTLSSLPFVGSQTMPCDSGPSGVSGHLVPSSVGMITDQSSSELLQEYGGKFSSQSFTNPPLVVTNGSTQGQDSSSNRAKSQVVGSIQQSNSDLEPLSNSDPGVKTEKGNMTAQVSRPSAISHLKRVASQPLSSTFQPQHRKTLSTDPLIHPSIPTWTRLAPSVQNTAQIHPPLIHTQFPSPQAAHSLIPPYFPPTMTKSALSAPNVTQTIPPSMQTAPCLPHYNYRTSSLLPSSHPPPILTKQQIAQSMCHHRLRTPIIPSPIPPVPIQQRIARSLPHQRLRTPIISSAPDIASVYIKCKDQTPEPVGHKCFLCKRDLSFTAEGPISQPSPPPPAAVLPCGHTFHECCLERMTSADQSKEPPCIPCALGE